MGAPSEGYHPENRLEPIHLALLQLRTNGILRKSLDACNTLIWTFKFADFEWENLSDAMMMETLST